ncbi:hypothetical protein HU200_032698 [Digitaria exilis]|uniref:Uncharacterized protein n=1 Tax=Digitaria exilis TaxID=1010633 RepID=A0A835BMR8_9POAL|nr:hypothetical protein HU200_032698 [Digitaria exilis]
MSASRRLLVTTSPTRRFLGRLKQPDDASVDVQEIELDESDVVWSSSSSAASSSSTSAASSPSPTPSPSPSPSSAASLRRGPISTSSRDFPSGSVGLSALLAEDHRHVPTAPVAATAAARTERRRQRAPHQSAPVAVPAWPTAMTAAERRRREAELEAAAAAGYDDDDGEAAVVPPHEVAARRAAAAASVMEGAGRTLKGRDLRRVRNAVWRTTGFLDL